MGKKLLLFSLLALGIWPLSRFCHHQTKGFSLSKIAGNISCLECQHSTPLPAELTPLLKQKFTYLGRGLQSFSFLSEDGKTVLKLFNNRYQRRLARLRLLPASAEKIAYNKKKWAMTFSSYELASRVLCKETGLLFLHPKKCIECPNVTIVDNIGIEHTINLSQYAYALQKKAELAYPYLSKCAEEENWQAAENALHSLVNLLKRKRGLNIADKDPLIRTNLGFVEGDAMLIDLGPFSYDPDPQTRTPEQEEIREVTLSLKHWMEKHHPTLLPYLEKALHQQESIPNENPL